jgi:hypothetical protein
VYTRKLQSHAHFKQWVTVNTAHKALQLSNTADGHSTVAGVAHPRCLFDKPATSAVIDGTQLCILADVISLQPQGALMKPEILRIRTQPSQ